MIRVDQQVNDYQVAKSLRKTSICRCYTLRFHQSLQGSTVPTAVRSLASRGCSPGWNPRIDTIMMCGFRLLLGFSSLHKSHHFNSISIRIPIPIQFDSDSIHFEPHFQLHFSLVATSMLNPRDTGFSGYDFLVFPWFKVN